MFLDDIKTRNYLSIRNSFLSCPQDKIWSARAFPVYLLAISRGDFEVSDRVAALVSNGVELSCLKAIEKYQRGQSAYKISQNINTSAGISFQDRVARAFQQADWTLLFTECWLERKFNNGFSGLGAEMCQSYLAYAMLKLGLRSTVKYHVEHWKGPQGSLAHTALECFFSYFSKDYSSIIDKASPLMPLVVGELDRPFYSLLFEAYAESLLRAGRGEELRELLKSELAANGESSWWLLFSGLLDFSSDRQEAASKWAKAGLANSFCINHSWGVNSFRKLGRFKFDDAVFMPLAGSADLKKGKPVVVACCDDGYLRQFLLNIYLNATKNPEVIWHHHIIVCGSLSDIMPMVQLVLSLGNVSISIEKHHSRPPRAYFTLPRFACVRHVLSLGVKDVLMTDIDLLSQNVLAGLKELQGQGAVGLHFATFYHHFPWHKVQINLSYYDGSLQSLAFIEQVVKWLEAVYDSSHPYQWWIDQVAVAMCVSEEFKSQGIFKLSVDCRKHFKLAGSSPDRKKRYMDEISRANPEIATLITALI